MVVFARKAMHALLALACAFLAPTLGVYGMSLAAATLFVLFLAARTVRALDPLRYAERASDGELYFALGVLLTGVLVLSRCASCFAVGMLVLAVADPLASLVGRRFGSHTYRVFGELRTIEGSGACCVATWLLLFGVTSLSIATISVVAIMITGVEALAPRGSDNLAIPLITGLLVSVL